LEGCCGVKSEGEEYFVNFESRMWIQGAYSSHEPHCFSFLQLREYQQKNSPGVPAGAKKKRKIKNGSSPETTTSGDCPSPEDVSLA